MYPDWPTSDSDLVPLPLCDGPKLNPFDFRGPQSFEFLDYIGQGSHAHVFKIKIRQQIYALKLFRFVFEHEWMQDGDYDNADHRRMMSASYHYSEPFSKECRAFGRLQEAGREDLAIKCFGYLLLDKKHEDTMWNQFSHLKLYVSGNMEESGYFDMRSFFTGKDGKPPPLRGIVKEFGQVQEDLQRSDVRRMLRNVIELQQHGIIYIDVGVRQMINGKHGDFSTAITTPHYITTPELNPRLTPEQVSAMEFETFHFSIDDYWEFDEMVREWNIEHENQKGKISVYAFPTGWSRRLKYNLRSTPSREQIFSFVDPRLYDWKHSVTGVGHPETGQPTRSESGRQSKRRKTRKDDMKCCRPRNRKPRRWYYNCDKEVAQRFMKGFGSWSIDLEWDFKDGLFFPRKRDHYK